MKDKQLYWVWSDMRQRCRNPAHRGWKNYGGRGIAVCERWLSYANFIADMGARPSGGMIERKNNDGPYSPENCRWATRKEQNSNRRNCIYVVTDGGRITLREYCRQHNLTYRPIVKRIQNRGWLLTDALSVPVGRAPKGAFCWKASA